MTKSPYQRAKRYLIAMHAQSKRAVRQGIASNISQHRANVAWKERYELARSLLDCAELENARKADDYATNGYKSLLPNDDSTYGQSIAQQQGKYYNPISTASRGQDCDVELDETERALVYCASRHDSPEMPLDAHK